MFGAISMIRSVLHVFGRRALGFAVAAAVLGGCAATLPPRPDIPYGTGLLWQIDKNGLPPSYVFGTMHVPDPEFLQLPPPVEDAFASSRTAAFELVTERGKERAQARRYLTAALLPAGQSLSDLLDSVAYAQVWRIAQRQRPSTIRIGRYHISRFKPWFVMETVGRTDATLSRLDRSRPMMDDMLTLRARKEGKTVVGLETFEEQLAITNDLPMDDQVALLKAYLDNYNNWHKYSTYAQIYRSGETAMFYGIVLQGLAGVEPALARRFIERYLDARNRVMVQRALPLIEAGSTFIAVGALHLPGEAGILRLLERRGYTVTRLH